MLKVCMAVAESIGLGMGGDGQIMAAQRGDGEAAVPLRAQDRDEVIEKDAGLLPCMSPHLTLFRHADLVERCPLLGAERKTSARSEHFAF
jgi:hypothetical protein